MSSTWDYLILTASNDRQAAGYESQLELRRRAGLLPEVGTAMVVADPQGKRVGSGGSTLYCLMRVIEAEVRRTGRPADSWSAIEGMLCNLRVLILHAGGDSRRLPAYGPCGKIFSPVPGETHGEVISTLFDRLYPIFRDMPRGPVGAGQVIVGAGDALPLFDAQAIRFDRPGMVALGAYATPEAASKHGVFCVTPEGHARLFLQKPSPEEQRRLRAIDDAGRSVLDIGVMSFDAKTAVLLFRAFDVLPGPQAWRFSDEMESLVLNEGLDLYREICCALGSEATAEHHRTSCRSSGSTWPHRLLNNSFGDLHRVPFSAVLMPQCKFLHFGATRQLVTSGMELRAHDGQPRAPGTCLNLNNRLTGGGRIIGGDSWVEGCHISAQLTLGGDNVVVGLEIEVPLELPAEACLDVIAGQDRAGRNVWFVRVYHVDDSFKETFRCGGTLAGRRLVDWLILAGARAADTWPDPIAPVARCLWNARVFPAVDSPQGYRDWLWMFDPASASAEQKRAFHEADRYSVAEIALLADMDAFYARRSALCDTP